MSGWRVLFTMVVTLTLGQADAAEDFLGGAKLYADVARYAAFGSHRFGSPGDRATTDWIAGELQAAGFNVAFQPVVLGRQYVVDRATAEVDGTTAAATPFWWPPEDKSSFHLTAPITSQRRCPARRGQGAGHCRVDTDDGLVQLRLRARTGDRQFSGPCPHRCRREAAG
ncbi:hypothetical protein [Bradyrhizobium sp. AZCC 2289]|uniref:hypothetical protein n=1 Tax=Bradyrhizobium sp. AZCC 2289 TaxID=3117026 RepID=UPI002FEF73F6